MAIIVLGASHIAGHTSKDILARALSMGVLDENGNTFELITLESLTQGYHNMHTFINIEDTLVDVRSGDMVISHTKKGALQWQKGEYSSQYQAQVARTAHNMDTLSGCYYFKIFRVVEPKYNIEIQAMADIRRKSLSAEELKLEKDSIENSGKTDKGFAVKDNTGKTVDERILEKEREALRVATIKLQQKEEDIVAREAKINERGRQVIDAGGMTTVYTPGELFTYSKAKVSEIALKAFGLEFPKETNRQEISKAILEEQRVRNQSAEQKIKNDEDFAAEEIKPGEGVPAFIG
jgi:hypothetical protein